MTIDLDSVLKEAADQGASDVHLTAGLPPQLRVHGHWHSTEAPPLTADDCRRLARPLFRNEDAWSRFLETWEHDTSYSIPRVGRFRVNLFFQRGSIGVACRALPREIPHFRNLGLPVATMRELSDAKQGLILVCGPTGSGKTTTLAAMIDHINRTRRAHIVTLEDPIEFLHRHDKSIVDQREVGLDTRSFVTAMRHVLRQSPDVVLVGEIRDQETISTALSLAETGHLVLSTIHSGEVVQGLSRITDMFPPGQQDEIRVTLAAVLKAMIVQQLVPCEGGEKQRALAYELLLTNRAVQNLVRTGRYNQVYSQLETQQSTGMRTMNESLLELWQEGIITRESALSRSPQPRELERSLAASGTASKFGGRRQ